MTAAEIAERAVGRCTQHTGELRRLCERVQALQPKTVLEIGVHGGGSLSVWAECADPEALLLGVDLDTQQAAVQVGSRQVLHLIQGDSGFQGTFERVRALLGRRPVDFLFIDGGHEVADVRGDYALYSPLVRSGGLIALHDVLVCSGPAAVWALIQDQAKELLVGEGLGTAFGTGVIVKQ